MAFLKKHSVQQISSIPSNPADSPWSTGVLTLGSFRSPHGPSSQLPWTPVDSQACPRYESLQPGLSVWFSLRSDGHRLVSSLPNSFKWLPHSSGRPWRGDLSPALQLLSPRLVPCALLLSPSFLSLLSFVLLSSVWIWIFHLSSQGVLPVFTWSSVRTAASLEVLDEKKKRKKKRKKDVLDASVERGVSTSTYLSVILSTSFWGCIRNQFPFVLSNIAMKHMFNFCFLRRTQVSSTLFSWVRKFSHVRIFVTPWSVAH